MNRVVWIRPGLVGALFLAAGAMKLITPVSVLAMQSPLPGEVLRVIGAFEVLGALVLLLPLMLRLSLELNSWAPLMIPVIVTGASIGTFGIGLAVLALLLVLAVLTALITYGRRSVGQLFTAGSLSPT